MASLVSSVYFKTRPVLGSLDFKVTATFKTKNETLKDAQMTGDKSKLEKELDEALESIEEVVGSEKPEIQAIAQLIRTNICLKRGNASLAHSSADAALGLFSDLKDKSGHAKALHAKALAHTMTDELLHAIQSAQKALAVYKELGDKANIFFELMAIARWQLAARKPYASLHTAKLARNMAMDFKQVKWQAAALLIMCESLIQSGQRAQAVTMAKEWRSQQLRGTDEIGLATAYLISVYVFLASDNPLDALDAAQSAVNHVENLDEKELEFDARYLKCQAHLKNKEEEEAAKTMRGAANLARELDDQVEEADALCMLSFAVSNMDNLDQEEVILSEGIEAAEEARSVYKTLGCLSGDASSLMMLAVLNSQKDDSGDLVGMVQEARELFSEAEDTAGEHAALSLLADLHMRAGQYAPALEFSNSSVDLWERFGSVKAQADAMQAVANVYVTMEDFEEAENSIAEAEKLAQKAGSKKLEASLAILLTKVYLEEGANDKEQEQDLRLAAMGASEKAIALSGQSGEKDLWAISMIWRSQVLSWAGRAEEALMAAGKAERAFEQLGDVRNQVRAMIKQAELHRALNKKAEAKEVANKALGLANVNAVCEGLERDAQAVLDSMVERRPQRPRGGGGGGGRMVMKTVKKWRQKEGGGGAVAKAGPDPVATMAKIKELVVNVLTDDEELTADMPFMEAGVDSLGSVQLVTDIGKSFQMPLAPSVVFDYPSIRTITDHLIEEMASAGGGAQQGGGGDGEWEEYEVQEEVWEEGEGGGDWDGGGDWGQIESAPQAQAAPVAQAAQSAVAPAQPKGLDMKATEKTLMELVKNVLTDDEELNVDMPFMEAGIDSLGSVQLVTDVGKAFRMPLAPSVVFDYPSVRSLCEHLVEESKG